LPPTLLENGGLEEAQVVLPSVALATRTANRHRPSGGSPWPQNFELAPELGGIRHALKEDAGDQVIVPGRSQLAACVPAVVVLCT